MCLTFTALSQTHNRSSGRRALNRVKSFFGARPAYAEVSKAGGDRL